MNRSWENPASQKCINDSKVNKYRCVGFTRMNRRSNCTCVRWWCRPWSPPRPTQAPACRCTSSRTSGNTEQKYWVNLFQNKFWFFMKIKSDPKPSHPTTNNLQIFASPFIPPPPPRPHSLTFQYIPFYDVHCTLYPTWAGSNSSSSLSESFFSFFTLGWSSSSRI